MDAGREGGRSLGDQGKMLVSHAADMGENVLGRWSGKCKGPETGECLTHQRSKEASVAGAE